MVDRVLRTGLTLLLTATVLLGSVVPPAVQHAHGADDHSHDHKSTSTTHPHPHRPPHSHPHKTESQPDLGELATWHRHVILFGWDFRLPVSDSPNFPSPGSADFGDQFEALVRLFDTNLVVEEARDFEWAGLDLSMDCITIEVDHAISPLGGHSLASLTLCDTARRERSGVLLV